MPCPLNNCSPGCPENSSEGDCSLERRAVLRGGLRGRPGRSSCPAAPARLALRQRRALAGVPESCLRWGRRREFGPGQVPTRTGSCGTQLSPLSQRCAHPAPTAAGSGAGADAQALGGDLRRVRFGSNTACARLLGFHARSTPWQSRSGLRENLTHVLGGLGSQGVDRNFK